MRSFSCINISLPKKSNIIAGNSFFFNGNVFLFGGYKCDDENLNEKNVNHESVHLSLSNIGYKISLYSKSPTKSDFVIDNCQVSGSCQSYIEKDNTIILYGGIMYEYDKKKETILKWVSGQTRIMTWILNSKTPKFNVSLPLNAIYPGPRAFSASCYDDIHDCVWLYGGIDSKRINQCDLWKFRRDNRKWEAIPTVDCPSQKYSNPSMAFLNGFIYLCKSSNSKCSFWKLDTKSNPPFQWILVETSDSLRNPLFGHVIFPYRVSSNKTCIVFVGGMDKCLCGELINSNLAGYVSNMKPELLRLQYYNIETSNFAKPKLSKFIPNVSYHTISLSSKDLIINGGFQTNNSFVSINNNCFMISFEEIFSRETFETKEINTHCVSEDNQISISLMEKIESLYKHITEFNNTEEFKRREKLFIFHSENPFPLEKYIIYSKYALEIEVANNRILNGWSHSFLDFPESYVYDLFLYLYTDTIDPTKSLYIDYHTFSSFILLLHSHSLKRLIWYEIILHYRKMSITEFIDLSLSMGSREVTLVDDNSYKIIKAISYSYLQSNFFHIISFNAVMVRRLKDFEEIFESPDASLTIKNMIPFDLDFPFSSWKADFSLYSPNKTYFCRDGIIRINMEEFSILEPPMFSYSAIKAICTHRTANLINNHEYGVLFQILDIIDFSQNVLSIEFIEDVFRENLNDVIYILRANFLDRIKKRAINVRNPSLLSFLIDILGNSSKTIIQSTEGFEISVNQNLTIPLGFTKLVCQISKIMLTEFVFLIYNQMNFDLIHNFISKRDFAVAVLNVLVQFQQVFPMEYENACVKYISSHIFDNQIFDSKVFSYYFHDFYIAGIHNQVIQYAPNSEWATVLINENLEKLSKDELLWIMEKIKPKNLPIKPYYRKNRSINDTEFDFEWINS